MPFSDVEHQALNGLWLPVALYAFAASASPGPVNIIAVSSGVTFGLRRTLPHILGAMSGFSALLFAIGMGLGSVLYTHPWILTMLKGAGSLFLCYLAYRLFTASHATLDIKLQRPPSFRDGILSQWLNPKAWIVSAAGTAAYTIPGAAYLASVLIMTGLFMLICFLSTGAWALFGTSAKRLLHTPLSVHRFNCLMAVLLLLSVATLFI